MRANELTTVQILTWRKISISLIEAGKGELKAQSCDMALFASIIREVYADPRIIRGTMARIAIRYCAY